MKTIIGMLLGLAFGSAVAAALLYYNPLTNDAGDEPHAADRVWSYSLPDNLLTLAFGEHALLPAPTPAGGALWEETIDRTALLALTLNDATGQPAAVATRFVMGAADTDLLLNGVRLEEHWLVTVPGEGTVFVRADSNVWPFLKRSFLPVWYFDRPWRGPHDYNPTVGPSADRSALLIGATGVYAGRTGSAVEQLRVTALDPSHGAAAAVGELHVYWPEQRAAAK